MRGPGENGPAHGEAFSPLFLLDVGKPLELCQEIEPSGFQRKWSKGYAQLDCNTSRAQLSFPSLRSSPYENSSIRARTE